jgi:site-specific DNA-methyltransferase (adenine-specific)
LGDCSASIIFLDPPFNLGKMYNKKKPNLDRLPTAEYENWLIRVLSECVRVLMPGGTLYLYHLPVWAMRFGSYLEKTLTFRHWIAISMKNGFVRGRRLYPAHYALLMFTKGETQHFARPKIKPATCRHCGNFVKDYGGYRAIIEDKGINLSDFWEDLSPVRHANRKHRSGNELPLVLFKRIIEISGSPGLLYVDPFAGTGSGVLAAVNAGMHFAACDIVESNCKIIQKRLRQLRSRSKRENDA